MAIGKMNLVSDDLEIVRQIVDQKAELEEAAISTADFWQLMQDRKPTNQCVQRIVDGIEDAITHAPGYWIRPGVNRTKWINSEGHWNVRVNLAACQRLLSGAKESEVAESLDRAVAAFGTKGDLEPSAYF